MISKYQVKGSGAIGETFDPQRGFQLEEITIKLSAAGGAVENLTIDIDDHGGNEYDINLLTQDMSAISNLRYVPPERPIEFVTGDKLDITYANTNLRSWGMTIKFKPING